MFCRPNVCFLNCFAEGTGLTGGRMLVSPALGNNRSHEAGRPQNEIPYSNSAWAHKYTSFCFCPLLREVLIINGEIRWT
jgi:hypothetical protein